MAELKREYPTRPIPGVAAVVLRDGFVLMVKRERSPGRGRWGLPGGVIELGETVRDAVVREILEESGLKVEPIRLLTVLDTIVRDKAGIVRFHYVLCEFLCRVIGGSLLPSSDALDARWIDIDKLKSLKASSRTIRFVSQVASKVAASC